MIGSRISSSERGRAAGKFQVEYRLQVPAGSSVVGYVWQHPRGADFSGANWSVRDGKFSEYGKDTDFKCIPGEWYKVTLRIDVEKHTWEFLVDGKRHESPKPLPFRGKVAYLDYIETELPAQILTETDEGPRVRGFLLAHGLPSENRIRRNVAAPRAKVRIQVTVHGQKTDVQRTRFGDKFGFQAEKQPLS